MRRPVRYLIALLVAGGIGAAVVFVTSSEALVGEIVGVYAAALAIILRHPDHFGLRNEQETTLNDLGEVVLVSGILGFVIVSWGEVTTTPSLSAQVLLGGIVLLGLGAGLDAGIRAGADP